MDSTQEFPIVLCHLEQQQIQQAAVDAAIPAAAVEIPVSNK